MGDYDSNKIKVVFDTNIWLTLIREKPVPDLWIEGRAYPALSDNFYYLMPAAVWGELLFFPIKHNWSEKKRAALEIFVGESLIIHTNEAIVRAYATLKAFSQGYGTLKTKSISARNLHEDDLWIAATAYVAKAILVTADSDFDVFATYPTMKLLKV